MRIRDSAIYLPLYHSDQAMILISRLQADITTTGVEVPRPTAVRKDIPKCRTGA